MKSSFVHLTRRAVSSLSNRALTPTEIAQAQHWLNDGEMQLWLSMPPRDGRHSLHVHNRFICIYSLATGDEHAAALLHDVGKVASRLGWTMRVIATVVGPRGRRFCAYHNHAELGAQMLKQVSSVRTVELVGETVDDHVSRALREADNI